MLKKAVSFVGFPLLCVVAVLHGLLVAFKLTVRNLGWIILFLVAAVSVSRNRGEKTKNDNVLGSLLLATILYLTATICVNFTGSNLHIDGSPRLWWETHKLIFLGLVATNAFSILYECGRAYWNWLSGKNKSDAEANLDDNGKSEPNGDQEEDFFSLLERIQEMNEITRELAEEWYKKIEEALKKDKIDLKEACSLKKTVDSGLKNSVQKAAPGNA